VGEVGVREVQVESVLEARQARQARNAVLTRHMSLHRYMLIRFVDITVVEYHRVVLTLLSLYHFLRILVMIYRFLHSPGSCLTSESLYDGTSTHSLPFQAFRP